MHAADEARSSAAGPSGETVDLRDAVGQLRVAFDDAPSGMAVLALDGSYVQTNRALRQMLGRSCAELSALNFRQVTHPDDVARLDAWIAQALDPQAKPGAGRHTELRYRNARGELRWALSSVSVIRGADHSPAGFFIQAVDITDRKDAESELTRRAHFDDLTALANRSAFETALADAVARLDGDEQVAVLFMDLDRFKLINDTFGHAVGDELLCQVADRLRATLADGVLIARLGGDEFTVLLTAQHAPHAIHAAERIIEALSGPFTLAGADQYVHASVGVATGRRGSDPSDLMRDADMAMYAAKDSGGSTAAQFDHVMHERASRSLEMENALHRAIDHGELRVFYQPKVTLDDERVCGAEALVRWDRPGHGLISPSEFIPMAEETGLVVALGAQVLRQACGQQAIWQSQHPHRELTVAVNVSARQLTCPDFAAQVADILRRSGARADRICLEVTESAVSRDPHAALATLHQLKAMGLQLAVDDFGTGFSSLAQIKNFPVDYLKIDRSFISGLGADHRDRAIVQSVVTLAQALGLTAIAEGIETREQLDELRRMGCPRGQGYLFARALSAADMTSALARS